MNTATIQLPYYKQGDDLAHYLQQAGSPLKALEDHAEMLKESAELLLKVKEAIGNNEVEFDCSSHSITITADDALIASLVELNLAEEIEKYEDEDDFDDDLDSSDLEDDER